jgi:4-hydroxybenzoate polyprenyltransferase
MAHSAKEFLETIKFEHTIFALPFAYMTLFLVEGGWPSKPHFWWVTLAMVAGRTFGMGANRLIDAEIDGRNPRTAERALPAGRLSRKATMVYMAATLALFLVAVWNLAPVCRKLWPIVLVAMVAYPYTKRITWLVHLFLGLVYFMIPTAIWIAVTGELSRAAVVLGAGAGLWVAGFDLIYACQDVDVDREQGLHSIPADLGIKNALRFSTLFHLAFISCMFYAGALLRVGIYYQVGVILAAGVLFVEHQMVSHDDLSSVNAAFFTANGVASIVLFILVAIDTIVRPGP